MPTPPEYPTNLVTSVKRVRKHSSVPSGNTLPRPQTKTARKAKEVVERKHAFRQASSEHRSKLQRDRERHARIAAVVSGATVPEPLAEDRVAEWFDLRKEWERAEMIETERLSVPESLPMPNVRGDLERDFERLQKRLAQYVAIRDMRNKMDEEHKEQRQKLTDIIDRLEGIIHAFLTANKLENLKTKAGTCYLSTRYSASVQDGEAFMAFVKDGHWDLIERRANPTAVRDYVAQNNTLPAGVSLAAVSSVGVRRPAK
jgi:hypothetical protein